MKLTPETLRPGRCFSNGAYGRAWGVRMVLECTVSPENGSCVVRYKGVAGACRRKSGECSLEEFRHWARYEVQLNENS
ncbi:MAG: hypothetical protein N2Z63_07685, partial [Thiobacillaceae bacterium]|nr:hypothetical protein [Thiobacillaceae bacterium]